MKEENFLTFNDYQRAVWAQEACNVSGLVHDLSEVISRIWKEARKNGQGTDWVNNHPIVRLYAEQIYHLSRKRDWNEAYQMCEKAGNLIDEIIAD